MAEFGLAPPKGKAWDMFVDKLTFGSADPDDYEPLVHTVAVAERAIGGTPRRLFHSRSRPPRVPPSSGCSASPASPTTAT